MAAYSKTTWVTGDLITAERMNKIEDQLEANTEILDTDIAELQEEIEKKADISGNYSELSVGVAFQLASKTLLSDNTPYTHRATPEGVGSREYLKQVIGASVVWNQSNRNNQSSGTGGGITYTNNNDGTWTLTGTATGTYRHIICATSGGLRVLADHVYYMSHGANIDGSGTSFYVCVTRSGSYLQEVTLKEGRVFKASTDKDNFSIRTFSGLDLGSGSLVLRPVIVDITIMFGDAIAEQFLALETAQAGAGAKAFRALFPNVPSTYDTGTLLSVQTSAHKTVGFNQWDEEWEVGRLNDSTGEPNSSTTTIRSKNFTPVIPGKTYYKVIGGKSGCIYFYDKQHTFIGRDPNGNSGSGTFVVPDNCQYIKFATYSTYGTTYKNDICINLSDTSRNGEYEPYVEHVYPLDDNLTLRGILRLDGDMLYADGDTYAANGAVTRKYAQVSFDGTEDWQMLSEGKYFLENSAPGCVLYVNQSDPANSYKAISNLYPFVKIITQSSRVTVDKSFYIQSNDSFKRVWIYDSAITTLEAFKTALTAKPLVVLYQLANSTTESAAPYTEMQVVDNLGTEEFVDAEVRAVSIPVGHVSKYMDNLRDKLEHLPSLAASDGLYIVDQNGANMSLVSLPVDSTLSESGKLADAKATGDALAEKLTASDIDATLSTAGAAADAKAVGDGIARVTPKIIRLSDLLTVDNSGIYESTHIARSTVVYARTEPIFIKRGETVVYNLFGTIAYSLLSAYTSAVISAANYLSSVVGYFATAGKSGTWTATQDCYVVFTTAKDYIADSYAYIAQGIFADTKAAQIATADIYEYLKNPDNLVESLTVGKGINSSGAIVTDASDAITNKIALGENDHLMVQLWESNLSTLWASVNYYDANDGFLSRHELSAAHFDASGHAEIGIVAQPANTAYAIVCLKYTDGDKAMVTRSLVPSAYRSVETPKQLKNDIVKSVNHRGWWALPENTLIAFAQSKREGFEYIEIDVRWTSDGVPVLLHDESINRTARNADGTALSSTVNIADITYETALTYDFGFYKGAKFAGTQICTLAECLAFCRMTGLKLLLEAKEVGHASEIITLVKKYGMAEHVIYDAFNTTILTQIAAIEPDASFILTRADYGEAALTDCVTLKTSANKVWLSVDYTSAALTQEAVEAMMANGIGLGVYTVNSAEAVLALDPYAEIVISDNLVAGDTLLSAALAE